MRVAEDGRGSLQAVHSERGCRALPRGSAATVALASCLVTGCTPTVNVLGTYFPPSMVSALIGLVVGYLVVRMLAPRPSLRPLAQSALFFGGISIIVGYAAWWGLFSGF